jgi:hypothetical protein
VGDNPLDLRRSTGRLRVGLEFDAPLTRLSERNRYRQALIEYQQSRRTYYQLVDRIARGLRSSIRTIELNQLNFELRRAAVQVAIAQVELARLRLQEPPKPEQEAVFGPTTARDLVQALSELLTAQNDFLSVFISYEVLRRTLDFDLGTMQLDDQGVWIDPGPVQSRDELLPAGEDDGQPESIEPGPAIHPRGSAPDAGQADTLPLGQPLDTQPDLRTTEPIWPPPPPGSPTPVGSEPTAHASQFSPSPSGALHGLPVRLPPVPVQAHVDPVRLPEVQRLP